MPHHTKLECHVEELADEAHTLLRLPELKIRQIALLIGKLQQCVEDAVQAGDQDTAVRLRSLAEELEKRLLEP